METSTTTPETLNLETVKAAAKAVLKAAEKERGAHKAAMALKEKQKRENAKVAKRETAKTELVRACEDFQFILPEGFDRASGATLDNCYRALAPQPWGYGFDTLAQTHVFRGNVPWPDHYGRELSDSLVLAIRFQMMEVFRLEFAQRQIEDTLSALCRAKPYNPVTDYLDSLKWDGVKRVGRWLHTYLGAPDDGYTSAVGNVFLVGAVARARKPGCKYDTMMILEGKQGAGKSTALKELGGDWYSDAELGNLKDKDAAMVLRSVWIHEMPELSSMTRTERNTMKAFVTRDVDRYRPTRANLPVNQPRRCVFAGTVNPEGNGYLTDTTGNRRYLPVETGKIDLAALRADRNQLWAEAAKMHAEGFSTVMPSALWVTAAEVAADRVYEDPWFRRVGEWIKIHIARKRAHTHEILSECLGIEDGQQTQQHGNRLAPIMRALGCAREKFSAQGERKPLNGWEFPEA